MIIQIRVSFYINWFPHSLNPANYFHVYYQKYEKEQQHHVLYSSKLMIYFDHYL